jgi:lauroyl/myristoyl acyltransferase
MLRLYRFFAWLVPRLPLGISYRIADLVGATIYLLYRPTREAVAHNQRRALGEEATRAQVARSTRRAMQNLVRTYVDEFRLPAMSGEALKAAIDIHGLQHLEAARALGKGVIIASAHYGSPQLVGQLLAVLGYPTTVVVEHTQPEALFEFMTRMRSSHGLKMLPIDKPLTPLIRALRKENGVVGLVVDYDVSGTGIVMPFMGEETRVADGPVQLALRTGAPIIVGFCRRTRDLRYEATLLPPLSLTGLPADEKEATRTGTARLMSVLESFIRSDPAQWLMTNPLWQHTP